MNIIYAAEKNIQEMRFKLTLARMMNPKAKNV
jgi:hypothetical protein